MDLVQGTSFSAQNRSLSRILSLQMGPPLLLHVPIKLGRHPRLAFHGSDSWNFYYRYQLYVLQLISVLALVRLIIIFFLFFLFVGDFESCSLFFHFPPFSKRSVALIIIQQPKRAYELFGCDIYSVSFILFFLILFNYLLTIRGTFMS